MKEIFSGFSISENRKGAKKRIPETVTNILGDLNRYKMRACQKEVYDNFKDKNFMICVQPPGSGKSMQVKFLAANDLLENPNKKAIIIVPETIIGNTFRGEDELDYGNRVENWNVGWDLCEGIPESKISSIIDFLKLKTEDIPNGIEERVLLCTHAAFSMAVEKLLRETPRKKYFNNCNLYIDEAHHVLLSNFELNEKEIENDNKLGNIVRHILNGKYKELKLWLLTATYHRGDKLSILTEKEKERFETYRLELDDYWENYLKYIETYSFDFVTFKFYPIENACKVLSKNKVPTIFYIKGGSQKYTFEKKLEKQIQKVWKGARILNLVEEKGRDVEKLQLRENSENIDVVIAVNMLDQGTDWPDAQQIIDLNPTNSSRVLVQRFGRTLRDKEGKKHLHYYTFLEYCIQEDMKPEDYKKHLNNHFTHFIGSMLLEDMISPIKLPKAKKKGNGGTGVRRISNPLMNLVDESRGAAIYSEIANNLCQLYGELGRLPSAKQAKEKIYNILEKHKIEKSSWEDCAAYLAKMLKRRTPNLGQSLSWMVDAGFEKVYGEEMFDGLRMLVTGVLGKTGFVEFRSIYETNETIYVKGGMDTWKRAFELIE